MRERAQEIVDESIGTLPPISLADMREQQKSDDVLKRVTSQRNLGRHSDATERLGDSKASLGLGYGTAAHRTRWCVVSTRYHPGRHPARTDTSAILFAGNDTAWPARINCRVGTASAVFNYL